MISSTNECVIICDLSDLTLQITFDTWGASMNIGLNSPIAWNDCRHACSWHIYSHCGIEEISSPGNIRIICHQVLRHPSEHEISSMGIQVQAKEHIVKLNESTESDFTELTSSIVDGIALAILKRQASQGITIVSSQRKFIFDIEVLSILTDLIHKTLQTGSE